MTEAQKLKRAVLSLQIIYTWAKCDRTSQELRSKAMRDIANRAAVGLGRPDLIKKESK